YFRLFPDIDGLHQLLNDPIGQLTLSISTQATYLVAWGDFLILIPAVLFIEEIVGRSWRDSQRWAVWILAAYAVVGLGLCLATGNPYSLPDPGKVLVFPLLGFLFALNAIKRYRPPPFPDLRIFLFGFGIFLAFVLAEQWAPRRFHVEPVGFF